MAESWYPNPGVTQLQHERLIALAVPSGVEGHPQDPPLVYATGFGTREIRILADRRASVLGYGWANDSSEIVLSLADNAAGSARVDLVVLRLDRADYSVRVMVVSGTPGAGAPALTMDAGTSGVWELPLAEVTVDPGATVITAAQVRNRAWYGGPDGRILCTSSTRPPHQVGRVIVETDTGRTLESTGLTWVVVRENSGPAALVIAAGFTAHRNVLRRKNGWVFAQLTFRRSSSMDADRAYTVATVPADFRPVTALDGTGSVVNLSLTATATVTTSGLFQVRVSNVLHVGSVVIHPMAWPID